MTHLWYWLLSVLVLGVIALRFYGKSRWWKVANYLVAAVLVGWGVSPWAPRPLGANHLKDVSLIVVDVSESMGPDPSSLFAKAHLHLPESGRLIVVAAGSQGQVCFDGPVEDYPDQLRPNQLDESIPTRLSCDLVGALDFGLRLIGVDQRAHLQIVSDGGFDLDALKVALPELRRQSIASLEARQPGNLMVENLGVRIIGPSRSFTAGSQLSLEVEVFGYTGDKRSLSLHMSIPGLPARELSILLEKGLVNRRLFLQTSPLPASASEISVALKGLGTVDRRLADNQDHLAIKSMDRPLSVLVLEGEAAAPFDDASMAPAVITRDPQNLSTADVVVVHDLDVQEGRVSQGFWEKLGIAVEHGVGLFLVGNKAAFGLGHWDGHLLDELSPLASKPGDEKRCLIVALDRSGSMENADRLKRAGRVVEETFARLGPEDRLVLLLFSSRVERFEFAKNDPKSSKELHQVLQRARASGGTNLTAVMGALVNEAMGDGENGLAFLLTDGRDSQAMTSPRVSQWAKSLQQKKLSLHLFWFDRDLSLRPLLLQLVGKKDNLVDVDDFGALQKPFFQAMSKDLVAKGEDVRLADGRVISLERVLRTRPQSGCEILASGSGQLTALAKIRRGLGKVAAAPIDLREGGRVGLWGESSLLGFIQSLGRPRSQGKGELQVLLDRGVIRLQLSHWQGIRSPTSVKLEEKTYSLRQSGPQQFLSDSLGFMPESQIAQVDGQDGTSLARLSLRAPGFVDAGFDPDPLSLVELVGFYDGLPVASAKNAGVHLGLLLLALVALGAELLLGFRSLR